MRFEACSEQAFATDRSSTPHPNDLQTCCIEFCYVLFKLCESWLGVVECRHHHGYQLVTWWLRCTESVESAFGKPFLQVSVSVPPRCIERVTEGCANPVSCTVWVWYDTT